MIDGDFIRRVFDSRPRFDLPQSIRQRRSDNPHDYHSPAGLASHTGKRRPVDHLRHAKSGQLPARTQPPLILRQVRHVGRTEPIDLLISAGTVADCTNQALSGVESIDLDGRFVMPGLWDAHVHFDQWSAARLRLDIAPARSAAEAASIVADRVKKLPAEPGEVLIGYGFRDGLWTDRPTISLLDSAAGTVPTVLISADLHAAWFNSAALNHFGRPRYFDGLLREQEWLPIMNDIARAPDAIADSWAAHAAAEAATRGVVGIVDFELPDITPTWQRRVAAGLTSLRVVCSTWPERLDVAIARGLRTGDPIPGTRGLATMGPLKVIMDGSLNTRTAYCLAPYRSFHNLDGPVEVQGQTVQSGPRSEGFGMLTVPPERLVELMIRAGDAGLETAVHAIGDHANRLALNAFAATGSRGTIEHAQLVDTPDFMRFAELGVLASVQPEHAMDDRDIADRYWAGRTGGSFAYGSLVEAGATLRFGSDAPVAPLDPWIAIAAATGRTRDGRNPWHPEQRISRAVALASSTRGRTNLTDGGPADLVVLDADPLAVSDEEMRQMPVAGTMLAGRWTYRGGF